MVSAGSWPYQVNILKASGKHVESVIPSEGATGWADTTMMHIDAPHPNCSYKWLELSLNARRQGVTFWKTPIEDCGNGSKTCIPYYQWVTNYVSVLSGN